MPGAPAGRRPAAKGVSDMTTEDGNHRLGGVREGMRVVDSDGEEVGTVAEVQMGDPQAVTAEGQASGGDAGLLGDLTEAITLTDDHLSSSARRRLERLGFIRVDARGWFSGDRHVASDQVESVDGDVVRLSVPKDQLLG